MIKPEFIISEISKSGYYKQTASDIVIQCPFHGETLPSLHISLGNKVSPGVWHCFGCNASGHWNILAKKLGLATVDYDEENENTFVNKNRVKVYNPIDEEDLPIEDLEEDFVYKKYNKSFLDTFGIKKIWHSGYKDWFLYFPVFYFKEYRGFIRVKMYPDSPGPKSFFELSKKVLYPYDYLLGNSFTTIVLVEGPADAFRLLNVGIPALALCGTKVEKKFFLESLSFLNVDTVIMACDGDVPGQKANVDIANILVKDYKVKIFKMPDGEDPDSACSECIKDLYKSVKSTGTNLLKRLYKCQ